MAEALAGMRALGIRGLSVTLPHKEEAAAAVDELSAAAAALGAVNTVVVGTDGGLRGENTDAPGFLAALADAGVDPAGRRCLVRGAGGAARAVVWALAEAGAVGGGGGARTGPGPGRRHRLPGRRGGPGRRPRTTWRTRRSWSTPPPSASTGGRPRRCWPSIPPSSDRARWWSTSIPRPTTALLEAAVARGAQAVDGLGMLVHQGALAFRMWTGCDPPIDVMRAAVRS